MGQWRGPISVYDTELNYITAAIELLALDDDREESNELIFKIYRCICHVQRMSDKQDHFTFEYQTLIDAYNAIGELGYYYKATKDNLTCYHIILEGFDKINYVCGNRYGRRKMPLLGFCESYDTFY